MRMNFMYRLAIGALLIGGFAQAQHPASPPANQPPPLGTVALPGSNYDLVFGMAEPAPGPQTRRHSHPGVVIVYLADGEFWYLIEGQPEQRYKLGDASQVPERAFPNAGQGSSAAAAMAIYIVERQQSPRAASVAPSR